MPAYGYDYGYRGGRWTAGRGAPPARGRGRTPDRGDDDWQFGRGVRSYDRDLWHVYDRDWARRRGGREPHHQRSGWGMTGLFNDMMHGYARDYGPHEPHYGGTSDLSHHWGQGDVPRRGGGGYGPPPARGAYDGPAGGRTPSGYRTERGYRGDPGYRGGSGYVRGYDRLW